MKRHLFLFRLFYVKALVRLFLKVNQILLVLLLFCGWELVLRFLPDQLRSRESVPQTISSQHWNFWT